MSMKEKEGTLNKEVDVKNLKKASGGGVVEYGLCHICGQERGVDRYIDKNGLMVMACDDCARREGLRRA